MHSLCASLTLALSALFTPAVALNITITQPFTPLTPEPLPAPHAFSDGPEIMKLFQTLGRTTVWKSVANVSFEGNTYEPEGLVRLSDPTETVVRYIVSAEELTSPPIGYGRIINGTDRSDGAGFAHLIVFDGEGRRIADATLSAQGDLEYHNGGIDYDGQHIWATIAQYRPNSTAHVARINPCTLQPQSILRDNDHLGGIVRDPVTDNIYALNWGSRNASRWNLQWPHNLVSNTRRSHNFTRPSHIVRNPSYFVDYQDCKFLGRGPAYQFRPVMLCSGVATIGSGSRAYNLGGIAIVDVETMVPLGEVPITIVSALGVPLTQNPVDVSVKDGKLRLYFLPDQRNSTLYVYEAQPDSPYEY